MFRIIEIVINIGIGTPETLTTFDKTVKNVWRAFLNSFFLHSARPSQLLNLCCHCKMLHFNYSLISSFCCTFIILLNQLLKVSYFTTFKLTHVKMYCNLYYKSMTESYTPPQNRATYPIGYDYSVSMLTINNITLRIRKARYI